METEKIFASKIIEWYQKNQRDLPWRDTKDAYKIWLSEIILQQTRVKQGLPYYQKFVETYPKVEDLAKAEESEVLRIWQGLGYYSRARNLHFTAKYISKELAGKFPNNYKDLLKLKGVGKYTASAIASFAFDEKVAVLDGNVYRVLARIFGIESDIAENKSEKEFLALAQSLIQNAEPALYNQAIMEFGAMQCSPQKPNCMFCPLQTNCVAFAQNKQKDLPKKSKKNKIKKRYFQYLIFDFDQKILLESRTQKDIWQGLYQFFLYEGKNSFENIETILVHHFEKVLDYLHIHHESEILTQKLTHQHINVKFVHITIQNKKVLTQEIFKNFRLYDLSEIQNLAKPILLAKYLENHFF